ncbi:MAG: GNAT family N-acetyltransferase [Nonlabens sp.]|nr:GNAT family N-acetyltransferase [Nonlabens sp.]MDP5101719.1 GNAT family N-acetyltransferase [Nonlabens sp.]
MTIKLLRAIETYPVRLAVLRKGRTINDCAFPGDDLTSTFHLGAHHDEELVAVATFLIQKDNQIEQLKNADSSHCYQLRGMAVLDSVQGKHVGSDLLLHGEQLLRERGCSHVWFNAREGAVPFYKKQGYQIVSDIFEIVPVGMHYKMYKAL